MYTCVAKNVVGKAYVAAYLQVASASQLFLEWVFTLNTEDNYEHPVFTVLQSVAKFLCSIRYFLASSEGAK